MLAYKTQISINDDFIYLKIPRNFKGKRVEVIVLETENYVEEDTNKNEIESFYDNYSIEQENKVEEKEPNNFQKFLLSAPTWNEEQYQDFYETRKLFNQWKVD